MPEREVLQLSAQSELERWLVALEDCRVRTLRLTGRMTDEDLARGEPNSISSVLYHIAAIEADWLFDEIRDEPEAIPAELFPHDVREESGVLTPIAGMTLQEHLDRLEVVRGMLMDTLKALDFEALHRLHVRSHYDVSPAYVLHHLMQHEAEHRAEIGRALARP